MDSCLRRNDRLEGERWLKGPTGELGFGRSSETGAEDKDKELDPRPPIRAFEGMFRHSGVTDWGRGPGSSHAAACLDAEAGNVPCERSHVARMQGVPLRNRWRDKGAICPQSVEQAHSRRRYCVSHAP